MVRSGPEVRFHEGSTRVPPGFHQGGSIKSTACCWGYHLSLFWSSAYPEAARKLPIFRDPQLEVTRRTGNRHGGFGTSSGMVTVSGNRKGTAFRSESKLSLRPIQALSSTLPFKRQDSRTPCQVSGGLVGEYPSKKNLHHHFSAKPAGLATLCGPLQ